MESPREEMDETQAALEQAEAQDDVARLQALEELHSSLETELERGEPQRDQPTSE